MTETNDRPTCATCAYWYQQEGYVGVDETHGQCRVTSECRLSCSGDYGCGQHSDFAAWLERARSRDHWPEPEPLTDEERELKLTVEDAMRTLFENFRQNPPSVSTADKETLRKHWARLGVFVDTDEETTDAP